MDAAARTRLQEAMVRLHGGDRGGFAPTYAALWPLFLGLAQRQLGPEGEDVAQEALIKLFTRIDRFEVGRDALSWALGTIAYEIRTERKRRLRSLEVGVDRSETPELSADPEAAAIARELTAAAADVLGTLRPSDIEVLERAARGEREPGPTFRKRLERALACFRTAWRSAHELD